MNTYKFEGKKGRMYVYDEESMKQNANCPDSEKSGTGPGSCGGSVKKESKPNDKPSEISSTPTKIAVSKAKAAAKNTRIDSKRWESWSSDTKQKWAKAEARDQVEELGLSNKEEKNKMIEEIASEYINIMDKGKHPSAPRRKKTPGDYAQYD